MLNSTVTSNITAIALSFLVAVGIILSFTAIYLPALSKAANRASNRLTNRFNDLVMDSLDKNKLLFKDRFTVERQLELVSIKLSGKKITIETFAKISIITSLIGFLFGILTTTKAGNYNIPAIIIATATGFILPRWYLVVLEGQMRHKVAQEAPQALAKITDFIRRYANTERAVTEATRELPKNTRQYFSQAWEDRKEGKYQNFTAMMYAVSNQSRSAIWSDFAHFCLVETTLGSADKLAKVRALQSRARKVLIASKTERKYLHSKVFKMAIAYAFLFVIITSDTLFFPQYGIYLYNTAIGRSLITAVYLTIGLNTALFTYLYYDN